MSGLSRFVRVPVFCAATGYTEKAVTQKRQKGQWREGQVWRKAPDGNVLIDMQGFEKWVQRGGQE
jgi:hypothetical protein